MVRQQRYKTRERFTVPLASSEQRGIDPMLTSGVMLTARDVVVEQDGRSSKRTGLQPKTGTYTEKGIACTPSGQPVLIGDYARLGMSAAAETGFGAPFFTDADDAAVPDPGHHVHLAKMDSSIRHCPTRVDRFDNPWHTDLAVLDDGNYVVASSSYKRANIAVLDQDTGAVLESYDLESANWSDPNHTPFVELVTSANGDTVYIYIDPDDREIYAGTVSSSAIGAPSSIYSTQLAKTPSSTDWLFGRIDCCAVDGDNIAIVFITDDTTDHVVTLLFDAANVSVLDDQNWTFGDNEPMYVGVFLRTADYFNVVAYDRDGGGDSGDVYIIGYRFNAGAIDTDASNWPETVAMQTTLSTDKGLCYGVTGVAISSTVVMLYSTQGYHNATTATPADQYGEAYQRRSIKSVECTAGSPVTVAHEEWVAHGGFSVLTKPVLDANSYPTFAVVYYPRVTSDSASAYIGPTVRTQLGSTFVVKHFTDNLGSLNINRLIPVGKTALGRTFFPTNLAGHNQGGSSKTWDDWAGLTAEGTDRCPSHMVALSDTEFVFSVPLRGTTVHGRVEGFQTYGFHYQDDVIRDSGGGVQVSKIELDPDPVKTRHNGDLLQVPGACPLLYDGQNFFEDGDLIYPEDFTVNATGTGADIGYAIVPYFTDKNGTAYYGTPVFTDVWDTNTTHACEFVVARNSLTRRKNTKYLCYRTKDAGTTYYYLGILSASGLSSEFAYASFSVADADLGGPGLYTDLEVENSQPPPGDVSCIWHGREFFASADNPSWLIQYSKQRSESKGPEHNEIFQLHCSSTGGDITALEPIGDSLLIFKESRIYATHGAGLAPSGAGTGFAEPVLIDSSVGATGPRTICQTPDGVLFLSKDGIHLVTRGLSVEYIGKPVQQYTDDQDFSCAITDASRGLAVFIPSTAGESALVYDYVHRLWTTWTNYAATDAAMVGDEVWVKSLDFASKVMREDRTSYVDNQVEQITPAWETGWISTNGLAGFNRLKEVRLLGYNIGAHTLTVEIAYDYAPDWIDSTTYDSSDLESFDYDEHYGAMGSDLNEEEYVIRFRGTRTKFSAIRFRFTIS